MKIEYANMNVEYTFEQTMSTVRIEASSGVVSQYDPNKGVAHQIRGGKVETLECGLTRWRTRGRVFSAQEQEEFIINEENTNPEPSGRGIESYSPRNGELHNHSAYPQFKEMGSLHPKVTRGRIFAEHEAES